MAYQNYIVRLNFNDGTNNYDLPYVQNISDPIPGIKANVIRGVRADGAIVIPGGKKPVEIDVKGILWTNEGYADLVSKIDALRTAITTLPATLTLKHWEDTLSAGGGYVTDWAFTVRRIEDITFGTSMRTESIDYNIKFLITGY